MGNLSSVQMWDRRMGQPLRTSFFPISRACLKGCQRKESSAGKGPMAMSAGAKSANCIDRDK